MSFYLAVIAIIHISTTSAMQQHQPSQVLILTRAHRLKWQDNSLTAPGGADHLPDGSFAMRCCLIWKRNYGLIFCSQVFHGMLSSSPLVRGMYTATLSWNDKTVSAWGYSPSAYSRLWDQMKYNLSSRSDFPLDECLMWSFLRIVGCLYALYDIRVTRNGAT